MTEEERQLIKDIRDAVYKQGERMRRIERTLVGDPEFRVKGVLEKVEEHDTNIQKYKLDKAKLVGFGVGSGVAGGSLFAWIKHLFS